MNIKKTLQTGGRIFRDGLTSHPARTISIVRGEGVTTNIHNTHQGWF